jgi:hypothetical protein
MRLCVREKVMKTKHAVAHAMVVSFALGAVAVPVDYAVAQAWWTVAGQSQTINAEPSASLKLRFPAREAEPSAADFYFGNSVGGAGAAGSSLAVGFANTPIATAWAWPLDALALSFFLADGRRPMASATESTDERGPRYGSARHRRQSLE